MPNQSDVSRFVKRVFQYAEQRKAKDKELDRFAAEAGRHGFEMENPRRATKVATVPGVDVTLDISHEALNPELQIGEMCKFAIRELPNERAQHFHTVADALELADAIAERTRE